MKKSTLFIGIGALIIVALFYWNMHRNGSFNDVLTERKEDVTHDIYGVWVEGSFKQEGEGDQFGTVQKMFIEELKQDKVCVFYEMNPRKENQESFRAFIGTENREVLKQVDSLQLISINFKRVISGSQICTPGFQKIHGTLIDLAEKDNLLLRQDSLYEEYSENAVYVEMKLGE